MFEGLVHRVLVGYLGRFVKNIQKDQLKLKLWNEEVLLENVELIPEAFDYLQLPFALRQGRVGRLSIRVSWKKLGWDHPIIIALEDVFIFVSQRDDQEWGSEAVEKRELAGKKAQLAAAELAKLSRRVCENHAGKSFMSYITAKVLDSIQLSIKNFHVQYGEMQFESVLFGLRFSNLMIKQNLVGSFLKVATSQVSKIVDIEGLDIYCNTYNEDDSLKNKHDSIDCEVWYYTGFEVNKCDHLLQPVDVSVSLVINKPGKLDVELPQYSIKADITGLAMSLNEVQLHQILILLDYLSMSHLRERYGRYRPWGSPLSKKLNGWAKLWWHYAQESVLSDVRRRLKKTSWRYLGQRLSYRRKYITLYKTKLDLLRQELPIDEHVLLELEQMEKECDVDDILIYRSAAEHELQEVLSNSLSSNVGVDGTTLAAEGSRIDERRSRGWLNWLSRGMLGAGGTDDSIQFSGVVTDEVVEDIYKATKFHPSLVSSDADINHKMLTCVIKLNILQISVTLQNKTSSEKIADLIIEDSSIEYKLWEDVASFIFFAMSGVIANISKEKLILKFGQSRKNQSVQKEELNPCRVQVDLSPNHEVEISTKVMLQPVEVYINIEFLQNLNAFLAVLTSVNFQHDRVLLSLNGIKDIRTRLSSKAEFILSGHKRLDWDVNINNLAISVPWINANSDCCNLAFELGSLRLTSQYKIDSADSIQRNSAIWKQLSSSTPALSYLKGFCVQDLYENFEVQLDDLELKLIMPQPVQVISVVEKCCSSINMAFCVIPYESSLKQLEVIMVLGSLNAHFSQLIYESLVTLIAYVDGFYSRPEYVVLKIPDSFNSISGPPQTIGFSVTAYLGTLCFHVNLSDDGESYSEVMVTLQDSVTKYSHLEYEDCIVTTRALKIVMPPLKDDTDTRVLCTSGNLVDYVSSHRHDFGVTSGNSGNSIHGSTFTEPCMVLHYKFYKSVHPDLHEFTVSLDGAHLHFYPYVFGLLFSFCNRISLYTASSSCDNSFDGALDAKDPKGKPRFSFEKFGYSNFGNSENDDINTISLDRYPFVTIYNSGSLDNLENSLCYSPSNWRNFANLREKKDRSPNLRMESGTCSSSAYTSPSSTSGNFGKASIFNGNINLSGLRVHLHDSSCIVGTLSVPIAKSSILSCDDFMDVLFSTEGMVLSSSWWTKNVQEFMWGPSLSSLSPILNLRIRKGVAELSSSQLEVSIGIQHVCCTLSAEYLAIIIGYFSLPDWCSNLTEHDTENPKYADMESDIDIVYKFEILDSTLIVPVEQVECPYLKLGLLQFYCSFMLQSAQNSASTNIPRKCEILDHKVAGVNHCLNIFGRDLNLFLMLYKYDNNGLIETDQYNSFSYIPLIAPLNVDVSIRMQYENESYMQTSPVATCIMSRIGSCQLVVDDCYTSKGVQALLDFINQLSTVEEESKHFTSDVSSFLQFKRSVKENAIVPPVASDLISFEIQCFADKLSMELRHLKEDTASSESVGRADMKFQCSVCLENDALKNLDLHFYSLTLHSSRNPVLLIQCLDASASPSSLHICLSRLEKSQNEFCFSLPSLDIWLYLYEWIGIIDLLNSIVQSVDKANLVEVSLKGTSGIATGLTEHVGVSASQGYPINGSESNNILDHVNQKAAVYTLRSDNVGLQVHFPLSTIEATLGGLAMDKKAHDESWKSRSTNSNVQNSEKFVAVSARSRSIELSINGRNVKQNSIWEKISGAFGICEDNSIDDNWPLFQISQLTVITDIPDNQMEILSVHLDCNQLDLWISYRVFCFLYGLRFDVPGATSSNSSLANMDLDLNLRKVSLQISDERWSCGGLLLEILLRNFRCSANLTENNIKSSIFSELEVNYNNIHKVFWEPFLEPWNFQINFTRKQEISALLSGSVATEVHLASSAALNLNFTEPLAESVFRTMEMVNDARYFMESNCSSGTERFLTVQVAENVCERRYTPYVLQNLTSLPLLYHVFRGLFSADELNISDMNDGKLVEPGASVPIYFSETLEEQLSRFRPAQSSDRLNENQLNGPVHHFMRIRLEGMSLPSAPISMDLVGLTYFEVYVSSASSKTDLNKGGDIKKQIAHAEESSRSHTNDGFAVPVVFDVSMQRYSKLIRLYSTVILSNATSVPLELRFDIPLGVSPKILDPVYPGQKVPLPLHLAEAGRIRWRPLGNTYLWSETHDISNILSKESNLGFLRSFVCYPSNPSSDPFRCCISVQNFTLPSASMPNKSFYHHVNNATTRKSEIGARSIRQLTLSTPLIASNYLSEEVLLSIESGGITRKILLSEVETSIHHVDPSHDLSLELNINGYQTSHLKFPRTETFSSLAKFSGRKFSLTESVTVYPHQFNGPLSINIEKMMDPFSGARELYLSVPFLIYNCLGIPLTISELTGNTKGCCCTVPSCYNLEDNEPLHVKRIGLSLLSLDQDSYAMAEESQGPSHLTRIALPKKTVDRQVGKILSNPLLVSSEFAHKQSNMHEAVCQKDSPDVDSSSFSNGQNSNFVNNDNIKVKPCMYSPHAISSISEATVRVSKWSPLYDAGSVPNPLWSEPFLLVPPSGSSTVLVPRSTSSAAAYILSVTSTALVGSFARHTQAVSFQPRYVISNGCNKDLCFRQKGTDAFIHLRVGQHSHLHWTDTTRELLISIRFNEPGWQWSGSFLPDHLGDTQLKMWNCDTGALTITRVEVQTADVSSRDEKIVGSLHGNSGTNLILISDDDTGFMPYRIDNFTKERLRVYQQKCETFDTVIHPYTSRPYAWDEPSFPHRLSIELPGERVIGSYMLDDIREYEPVHLKSTAEKPERILLVCIRAEGARKVLSIMDSSCHLLNDLGDPSLPRLPERKRTEQRQKNSVNYKEEFSVSIPQIGISLINAYPQELLFVCAKKITLDLLQSLDQQKLSFELFSLQIDNQLHSTPYPVILSFNEIKSNTLAQRTMDDGSESKSRGASQIASDCPFKPAIHLSLAIWRRRDISLVSFEYIRLRVANFRLELEQELILSLIDFFKAVSLRSESKVLSFSDPMNYPPVYNLGVSHGQTDDYNRTKENWSYAKNVLKDSEDSIEVASLPSVVPVGAPWQQIYLLAKRHKKMMYVELFDMAPIYFSLSFSSSPWMLRNGFLAAGDSLIHRGLVALADVEGAQIRLKRLTVSHQMASWESMQDIVIRHYMRQFLLEMYKVFGSAGVIGNPMGFARSLGLGIRDFLSVPARSILQSPTELITGVAQGTSSLVSNTVYALSDAATQFSKAAHKGIVAFAFDDQSVARMEKDQRGASSHSRGVINEVFEGFTGLLQSPIKEAEKHGLPGLFKGLAYGVAGLVARPAASILEVTGKAAQSIRNRSRLYQQHYRVRFPRPLSRELPLKPYSLEEAVGALVLMRSDGGDQRLKDELLVTCKSLKEEGKFVVVTEKLLLVVSCSSLADAGKPEPRGVPVDPKWIIESEISLESIIHVDTEEDAVHIVGSSSDDLQRRNHPQSKKDGRRRWRNPSTSLPLLHSNLEFATKNDAADFFHILLCTIEQGKERGWGSGPLLLHQSNINVGN